MKILLVEDERYMAEALEQVLKKNNYSVCTMRDGEAGLLEGLSDVYDIIILDIMLPKRDGLSVLKALRNEGIATPVLLLTAKGDTNDKVQGLDSGADDYLPKPFEMQELLARLRALGRRKGELAADGLLRFEDLTLDPNALLLFGPKGQLHLTLKECQVMELFLWHKGAIITKDSIIERLWGYESDAQDNHAEVYISFLRKKIGHIGANAAIRTLRGVGYTLARAGHV